MMYLVILVYISKCYSSWWK